MLLGVFFAFWLAPSAAQTTSKEIFVIYCIPE
jgi:hypothetical protein